MNPSDESLNASQVFDELYATRTQRTSDVKWQKGYLVGGSMIALAGIFAPLLSGIPILGAVALVTASNLSSMGLIGMSNKKAGSAIRKSNETLLLQSYRRHGSYNLDGLRGVKHISENLQLFSYYDILRTHGAKIDAVVKEIEDAKKKKLSKKHINSLENHFDSLKKERNQALDHASYNMAPITFHKESGNAERQVKNLHWLELNIFTGIGVFIMSIIAGTFMGLSAAYASAIMVPLIGAACWALSYLIIQRDVLGAMTSLFGRKYKTNYDKLNINSGEVKFSPEDRILSSGDAYPQPEDSKIIQCYRRAYDALAVDNKEGYIWALVIDVARGQGKESEVREYYNIQGLENINFDLSNVMSNLSEDVRAGIDNNIKQLVKHAAEQSQSMGTRVRLNPHQDQATPVHERGRMGVAQRGESLATGSHVERQNSPVDTSPLLA